MEPRLRACPEQFTTLVKFMERQGDLSKPQMGAQGRSRSDRLWLKLARILNSIEGGVEKTVDKWKKVWADWKTKTKKKYLVQKRRSLVNSGGPKYRLTTLEQRVIAILGVNAAANHVGNLEGYDQQPQSMTDDPLAQDVVNEVHLIVESPKSEEDLPPQSTTPPQRSPEGKQPRHNLKRPHTPPEEAESQAPTTLKSTISTPHKVQLRARRNFGQPLFHLAAQEFVGLEQRRLQLEETREKHEHEREILRLRLESQRIEVAREHNQLLQQLSGIANKLIDTLNH